MTKEYTNGELTILWNPGKCIHSAKCVAGLPNVFKPKEKPWIQASDCATEDLKQTIDQCPSGALSYVIDTAAEKEAVTQIEVMPGGPLILKGKVVVKCADGSEDSHEKMAAFCRCGASARKPYCDGSHKESGFKD